MNLGQALRQRYSSIGRLGRFLVLVFLAATVNFGIIFVQNWKAASASGTQIVDGYEITVCYFGPPVGFTRDSLFSLRCYLRSLGPSGEHFRAA
jgi:hypothetical protein